MRKWKKNSKLKTFELEPSQSRAPGRLSMERSPGRPGRQAVSQSGRQAGTTLSSVAMTVAHAVVVEAAASRPKTANCGGASNVDLQRAKHMCVCVVCVCVCLEQVLAVNVVVFYLLCYSL